MPITFRSLVSAGALITVGMLAGRLLGLVREMLLAAQFGTGANANIAIVLLMIPDVITSLLLTTAASATLVPAFAARSEEGAQALFWQSLFASVAAFTVIGFFIFLWHTPLSAALGHTERSGAAFALTLCALPLTAATAIVTAWLQHRGRLLVPAFANVIFNSVIVLALWLLPSSVLWLAAAIMAAALLRLAAHLAAASKKGEALRPVLQPWQLRKSLLVTYLTNTGTSIFNVLPIYFPYLVVIGSQLAIFNYAFKLALLPCMLIQTIIQLALLPWLVSLKDKLPSYTAALQLTWVMSLCLSLALMLASAPIAMLFFGHGQMTGKDTASVGALFAIGVWAVPGMALSTLLNQMFYAHENPRLPLLAAIAQTILMIALCVIGHWLWDITGVMLGFVLSQALPLIVLAAKARRQNMIVFPHDILPMSAAAAACFVVGALLYHLASPGIGGAVVLAMMIGAASLAAGIATNKNLVSWLITCRRAA